MSAMNEPRLSPDTVQRARVLVLNLAEALVDRAEAVQLEVLSDQEWTTLSLRVAPEDLGKIIGRQGRTARSIRTILAAFSTKNHARFALDIQELLE
jgi:predicted RNA-binding protein YlqC (UPF0109 family)